VIKYKVEVDVDDNVARAAAVVPHAQLYANLGDVCEYTDSLICSVNNLKIIQILLHIF